MLHLFPSAYIDNSLLTAVLLGVLLLWWLAERFGWPATGLVVPGYLGAILAVRPEAATVIAFEAVLTYGLSAALGRWLPRWIPVDRVFGRDRFFLIIVCSIVVRLLVEGEQGQALAQQAGLSVTDGWHSLGLVLVPLTANSFWKPGVWRGLPLVGIPVMLVFLLLKLVLLPYTNLSFTNFALTYEDLGWSFVDAPREYILLLLGTLIASHTTIRYGWDFGGVIVCGLLAIAYLSPVKLLATVVEILVVVGAMRGLQRSTWLRAANITGLRPMVLAFALAYLLKLALAWVSQGLWPGFRISDVFGVGYLLSAIVAVRVWRHGELARILVPALSIGAVACVGGLALGAGLASLHLDERLSASSEEPSARGSAVDQAPRVLLPPPLIPQPVGPALSRAVSLARAGGNRSGGGLRVESLDEGSVVYSTEEGIGVALLRDSERALELRVPQAWREPGLAEAAVHLAEVLDARLLLLAPSTELLDATHRDEQVLVVEVGEQSLLSVPGDLPPELRLDLLQEQLDGLHTTLDDSPTGELRLALSEHALLTLASATAPPVSPELAPLWSEQGFPSPSAPPPDALDLALLDRGVLRPLLRATEPGGDPRWIALAARHAQALGMELSDDGEIIRLAPQPDQPPPRFTLSLRRGGVPLAVEVRGAGRHYQADKVGLAWWEQTGARALLVRDARVDLDAEALRRQGPWSSELVLLRQLAAELPGLTVLSVNVSREDEIPGADAVVSIGRPLAPGDLVPEGVLLAEGLVAWAGGRPSRYDGQQRRLRYYDPANPRRAVVQAAGGQYVTVYLAPAFRLQYAGLEPGSPLTAMLSSARIPIREARLDQLLELPASQVPPFPDLLAHVQLFSETRHPGALDRFRRDARHSWAFSDQGLTFLVAERGELRMILPLGQSTLDPAPYVDHMPGPPFPLMTRLP